MLHKSGNQIRPAPQVNSLILKTQSGSSVQFYTHPNPAAKCTILHNVHNFAPWTAAIGQSSHSAANHDVIR